MASPLGDEDDIFEKLQNKNNAKVLEERQKAVNERLQSIYGKAQARLGELIDQNSTLPCTISSIHILGAPNTRKGFLGRIFDPLLAANQEEQKTLSEVLREVTAEADKLQRFDIFSKVSLAFDRPDQTDPSTSPTDISVVLSVKEKPRYILKTGTDLGNAEGSAYGNFLWRNVLGGAETVNLNASLGTRTKSAYSATFDTPILSNPDFRFEVGGNVSTTQKSWASHEEGLKGGWAKLRWLAANGTRQEVSYNGVWRQITGLSSTASPTVREDAGDSVKSSVSHTWTADLRDNPLLPTYGAYARTYNEVAGYGPLKGDVAFWKSEVETQAAVPIPIPGIQGPSGVSFTAGLRAGLLYPLAFANQTTPQASHINDRFQLGGPTDVRGFRLSGLGPRDGADAVGGDMYAAGSANLLLPLPRLGADSPFRFQAFVNGGRLLSLSKKGFPNGLKDSEDVAQSVKATFDDMTSQLPSVAAGVGLVYAHPVARFELNFSLPVVLRKGEEGRKGLSFGVGISFL